MSAHPYPPNECLQVVESISPAPTNGFPSSTLGTPANTQTPLYEASQEKQLAYGNVEKEVVPPISAWDGDDEEKETLCGMRRRNFLILLGIILAVIIAIAVGAGVGVSMSQKSTSSEMSPISSGLTASGESVASSTGSRSSSSTSTPINTPSPTPSLSPTSTLETSTTTTSSATTIPTDVCNGAVNQCNTNGCTGKNDPNGGYGTCTAGLNAGCSCISLCGAAIGFCDQNDCAGVDGFCSAGVYIGCACAT